MKVNLYLQEFHKTEPTRQKLWTLSLATLLFPQHPQNPITHDIISIEDFNHFFRCCLTVLELNEDLIIPYSIEYDSEEEALTLQQENYKVILNSITAGVSKNYSFFSISLEVYFIPLVNKHVLNHKIFLGRCFENQLSLILFEHDTEPQISLNLSKPFPVH